MLIKFTSKKYREQFEAEIVSAKSRKDVIKFKRLFETMYL